MEQERVCGICQEESPDIYRFCKCAFFYHESCVNDWKKTGHTNKCHLCKKTFSKGVQIKLNKPSPKKRKSRKKSKSAETKKSAEAPPTTEKPIEKMEVDDPKKEKKQGFFGWLWSCIKKIFCCFCCCSDS